MTPLHSVAVSGDIEMAKLLVKHGADVNAIDKYGITPLVYAEDRVNAAIAKLVLIVAGINTTDKDSDASSRKAKESDKRAVAKLLRQHGAKE